MLTLPTYVLITPARDEAQFIELTIKSVVAQSARPIKWVIVSDGSTDGTDEIVSKYAADHPWIQLVRMPERRERHFAGKVHAFNAGYARVRDLEYEVVGSLDGDASFDQDYFSFLLRNLAEDPTLGLVGTPFKDMRGEIYDYRFVSIEHVSGVCQLFRRKCFEEIGGYVPVKGGGVDLIAVITARMKGWKTRTFTDKVCLHHRQIGTAQHDPLMARFRTGVADYALGGHPIWELSRTIYQMTRRPFIVGGLALGAGYGWALVTRVQKAVPPDLAQFRRAEQMRRLRNFFKGSHIGPAMEGPKRVSSTNRYRVQMMGLESEKVNNLKAIPVEIKWHSGMPIYASEAFLKSVGDQYGWIGGTDDSAQLRCVLPYTIIRKPGFRMVRFRVETIPLEGELDLGEERSFLNSAIEYFRSTGADMIIPSGNTAIFRTYPDGAAVAPYGTFVTDLDQTEEALMSEIRRSYRQNIRRAIAAGVQIKCGLEYLEPSYCLVAETLRRSGVTFKTYSELKRTVLSLGEYVKIFVAEHDGVIQGCMVSPFSESTAYSWYTGSRPQRVWGSMHLLFWEAIRQFRAMGIKHFNFQGARINPEQGSKQEGIMTFKKRFGGRLVQGYMWKYSFRPLKSIVYSVAVRILKGGDIVDQEHHKLVSK